MHFPTIWFLRHGETEWNAEHRIQGQLESQLTQRGRGHAALQRDLVAPILAENPPCYVSPLGRARETAEIALAGHSFQLDDRLAEAQAGVFQGMTLAEVEQAYPDIYAACPTNLDLFCAAPAGEGFASFHARILEFMSELTQPTVVIAHGLLGQVIRGIVCGLPHSEMGHLPNDQGCIYLLREGREEVLK